jgi:AcrR family transcriptional regulator
LALLHHLVDELVAHSVSSLDFRTHHALCSKTRNPPARDTAAIAEDLTAAEIPRRGRPPAATRDDVLDAALHRYLRGQRVDVQALAAELGVGRTTIYRWFGSREQLLGQVVARAAEAVLETIRAETRGSGGPLLLKIFDRFNRALADAPALRAFLEQERDTALRIINSSAGVVTPRMVERISEIIEEQVSSGAYRPPVEIETLAYAIVRLAEAFIFNDAAAGIRGDVDRLRDVEAAMLGVGRAGASFG